VVTIKVIIGGIGDERHPPRLAEQEPALLN
jgi:hypothetical protein